MANETINQNLFNKLYELGIIATVQDMAEIKWAIKQDKRKEMIDNRRKRKS